MSELARASTVDALATALRDRILDGDLPAGGRLTEAALTQRYDVARHSVRAALRVLEGEGLVTIAPNRGARVAELDDDAVRDLSQARGLLEVGATRIALERSSRLPSAVHAAAEQLAATCRATPEPAWREVVVAHNAVHAALVAAAGSPRLTRAHQALDAELALFLVQGRRAFPLEELAADHLGLIAAIERDGTAPLQEHLHHSEAALLAP